MREAGAWRHRHGSSAQSIGVLRSSGVFEPFEVRGIEIALLSFKRVCRRKSLCCKEVIVAAQPVGNGMVRMRVKGDVQSVWPYARD
ncbi:MAG: hypothetical protein ACREYE_04675 [Gammaproteobacteria bacterium]